MKLNEEQTRALLACSGFARPHEAEFRELETDTLRRRGGRWYVKRAGSWRPLDPTVTFEGIDQ